MTEPYAPLNLANNPQGSSGKVIALVWSNGAENGGTPIIDY